MVKTPDGQPGARASDDGAPKPKSKTQRAREVVTIAQQVASGNSALTSSLLLHGLPLLAHVLPHTPQLFARFLLMLTKRGGEGDDEDSANASADRDDDDDDDDGAKRS